MAAFVVTGSGIVWTLRTLAGIDEAVAAFRKKSSDTRELVALRDTARRHRKALADREGMAAPLVPMNEILRSVFPGREIATRELDPAPAPPGWTGRRLSVSLVDVPGDDLGRLLGEASSRQPGWTLLECTLHASPVAGRLAKADLVFGAPERTVGR